MARKQPKSAKLVYRPLGLTSSILGGIVAGVIFKQLWKRATPGENADAPEALKSEYGMRQVLVAAAVEGAIFGAVKALIDRGGAKVFQRRTGKWPGD